MVEDYISKIESKIKKEVEKASKRFKETFNEDKFLETNEKVKEYKNRIKIISKRLNESLDKDNLKDVKKLIEELGIACPESGSKNWTDVKQFNLMFGTKLG